MSLWRHPADTLRPCSIIVGPCHVRASPFLWIKKSENMGLSQYQLKKCGCIEAGVTTLMGPGKHVGP